jgi:ubiquinone/menaquinone biosynthesis C-methylase UbiE
MFGEIYKMNNATVFKGDLLERATDSNYLAKRMEMNKGFQFYDFGQWAVEQIKPKIGDKALDVGCGRGTQAIPISSIIGKIGEIALIDLSRESVNHVLSCIGENTNARGMFGSMDNIATLLGSESDSFDVVYSVYALYYANNPTQVLGEMYSRLAPGGRLCIIGPDGPHGFVEIARRFHAIPPEVDSSFEFRSKIVEPFFKNSFPKFDISFLKNPQSITDPDKFIEFYRQTTYYVADAENDLRSFAADEINKNGAVIFNKYSYAVSATKGDS